LASCCFEKPTAHSAHFFSFSSFLPAGRQVLLSSLIINKNVGSRCAICFPLLLTCLPAGRKTAHFCAPRAQGLPADRQVRSGNKFLYKSLSSIFRNYNSSYTGAGKQAKESFMIVRFV
jgi:hypothetical protein